MVERKKNVDNSHWFEISPISFEKKKKNHSQKYFLFSSTFSPPSLLLSHTGKKHTRKKKSQTSERGISNETDTIPYQTKLINGFYCIGLSSNKLY